MDAENKHQSGNMLFILMVAIALFAGLALAVTNAGKSTSAGKQQKASLIATEIIDYANAVKGAVQKLKYRGCADTDISFENDDVTGYEHTPPAEDRCKIFHPSGGNVKWKRPDPSWMWAAYANEPYYFPKTACVLHVGTNGSDLSGPTKFCNGADYAKEHIILLTGITQSICEAINMNIAGTREIPQDTANFRNVSAQFNGNFGSSHYEYGGPSEIMAGEQAYCFKAASGANNYPDTYNFYMVLWAR